MRIARLLWLPLLTAAHAFAAPTDAALAKAIDAYVAPYVSYHVFSGVVLVAKGDTVLAERAYGMANEEFAVPNRADTRFRIASITKRFTSIVVTRLASEKKLALSDPLAKFAPAFPKADKITIDQLLNHRSGIRDPEKLRRIIGASFTTGEVVDLIAKEPLGSEPGATFSYTTANYAVLAFIVEKVTGESFAQVVRRMVYDPAGMTDAGDISTISVVPRLASGYMPDPFSDGGAAVSGPEDTSWKTGGGSGYATARDLHRFLRALYGGKLLLPGTTPFELFTHGKMFEKRVLQSSGAFPGANANATYFPDDALSIVVMSNNYAPVAGSIAKDVAAIAFGEPYAIPSFKPASGTGPFDARLLGAWTLEGFPNPATIEIRHGRPIVAWNSIRQSAFLKTGENEYFMPLDWSTFTVKFSPDGSMEGTWIAPWADKPLKIVRVPKA